MIAKLIAGVKKRIEEIQAESNDKQKLDNHVIVSNKLAEMNICLVKLMEIDTVLCEHGEYFFDKEKKEEKIKVIDYSKIEGVEEEKEVEVEKEME